MTKTKPKFYRCYAVISVIVDANSEEEALKNAAEEFSNLESDTRLSFEVSSLMANAEETEV